MIQQAPRDPGDAQSEADYTVAQRMIDQGGNFVHQLGHAYMRADAGNQARIREAFPDYWAQYAQDIEVRGVRPTGTGSDAAAAKIAAQIEGHRRALQLTAYRFNVWNEMPPLMGNPVASVIAPTAPSARAILQAAGVAYQFIRLSGPVLDVEPCGIER